MIPQHDGPDIDQIVDYKTEYQQAIKHAKISGDKLTGFCPFHEDKNPSFSADLRTGQWKCFAEDEGGNFITFYAKLHNMDNGTAYREILRKYSVQPAARGSSQRGGRDYTPYSLKQYAFEKHLPEDWLRERCGLCDSVDYDRQTKEKTSWLKIPYWDEAGTQLTYRKRYGGRNFRWKWGSSTTLYGLWRLPEFKEKQAAILVEGESDTQTLWYLGLPALGVPGASNFKPEQASALSGMTLYLHREPDGGGETFIQKTCRGLREGGFSGTVRVWSCKQFGVKDPSELFIKHGKEEAARLIREAVKSAEEIDIREELVPAVIPDAPLHLRQPEGWIYSDKGISMIDEKKYTPSLICRTPIILTKRIKHIETGEEKIEVAFKRDEHWISAIYPRSTIFSNRSILILSELGCTVTSENAKQVVKFLGALEAENFDLIPKADATGTFGWQRGQNDLQNGRWRFLPGKGDGLVLDIDPTQRGLAAAYSPAGTMEKWVENMARHRQRDRFRFILAAGFAAPLLRIVKQRIFFVYNWGGSKGGKTAAMKAALSAWGDPDKLQASFNATQVGLERIAGFYSDLPLGIDERQLAGTKQEALERIVYMIASGMGKLRGNKTGGLQVTQQWRTVALATGEEPLSRDTSQTGISTRVLEIYGPPFDNEADAGLMHQQAGMDCGHAGPLFIQRITALNEKDIVAAFEEMQSYVHGISQGKNGAHIAGVSLVALADAMIDSYFFSETHVAASPIGIYPASWERARQMAAAILSEQVEQGATDVNENAVQFIVDWVLANKAFFNSQTVGTCYGMLSEGGEAAYIFPSILNQALEKAGYSPRKTLKYMAENGLIATSKEKNGVKRNSVVRLIGGRSARFIQFNIGMLSKTEDLLDWMEDECEDNPLQEPVQTAFTEITPDDDLPF